MPYKSLNLNDFFMEILGFFYCRGLNRKPGSWKTYINQRLIGVFIKRVIFRVITLKVTLCNFPAKTVNFALRRVTLHAKIWSQTWGSNQLGRKFGSTFGSRTWLFEKSRKWKPCDMSCDWFVVGRLVGDYLPRAIWWQTMNPPGSSRAPFSESGCTLFVKLQAEIHPNFVKDE